MILRLRSGLQTLRNILEISPNVYNSSLLLLRNLLRYKLGCRKLHISKNSKRNQVKEIEKCVMTLHVETTCYLKGLKEYLQIIGAEYFSENSYKYGRLRD